MDLNLIAPINELGYGIVGKNITDALVRAGVKVSLFPINGRVQLHETDKCVPAIKQALDNARYPNWKADCIRLWHQHDMAQWVGDGRKIGFPIFELDQFTLHEHHHLEYCDKIFVCSEWAKEVVRQNLKKCNQVSFAPLLDDEHMWSYPENIDVVPLGVDTKIFPPTDSPNDSTVRFFNCGKTEIRKGHDVLHEVFNQAFSPEDDVELHIMWDNPFLSDQEKSEWEQMYRLTPMGKAGKIIFHPRVATSQDVAEVMAKMDCGIFLSRAEGWNLEALEMMSMGKEVIITNYSAHTEFCNSNNASLINITDTEEAYDGKWFFGQGSWAKLDDIVIMQAVASLQTQYRMRQKHDLIPQNVYGIETAEQFSWDNTAKRIIECLRQ